METGNDSHCMICCEAFNKGQRAPIKCELADCSHVACKTCTRTYLLSTTKDPHCMECKKGWSMKFLVENMNRSFVTCEYAKHRKKLLSDHETSRLPDTMRAAEQKKLVMGYEFDYDNKKKRNFRINEKSKFS